MSTNILKELKIILVKKKLINMIIILNIDSFG